MPYGLSDAAYAAEVDRKRKAGIPLTSGFDQAAYNRGKSTSGGGSGGAYGLSDAAYAQEVDRKRAQGIPLTQPFNQAAYYRGGGGQTTTVPRTSPSVSTASPSVQTGNWAQIPLNSPTSAQFNFPYEQLMRDIQSQYPKIGSYSDAELAQQAKQWASLQIDPQTQALLRAVEQARQSSETQRQQTEAAYAGFEDYNKRMMGEAAANALESAISRGGGRAGAVEWLTSKLQQPITEKAAGVQAEKAAKLSDIASQLALTEKQSTQQQGELQTRLGQLEVDRLAELRNLQHSQAVGDWQTMMTSAQNLANLATQAQQFQQQYAASLLPYYTQTEAQRQQAPLDWAQVMGEAPNATQATPTNAGAVPLRSYATQQGASIGYDPATKTITINGRKYGSQDLQGMGGQLINGTWYVPQSSVNALLGR